MEELMMLIQKDNELWEIVEQLKHPDDSLDDFILSVAQMFSIEFEILHRGDLSEKLSALFGGLPPAAFKMAPLLIHIALDLFLMRAIPNREALEDWAMHSGYVLCTDDLNAVLCFTSDKQSFEMVLVDSTAVLNKALCVYDLTEAYNVLKLVAATSDYSNVAKKLQPKNIARLYNKFY